MKKRSAKFYISLLLLILSSCSSLDKEEYEVLNVVLDHVVFKEIDQDYVSQIMEKEKINYSNAINIVQNEMSQKEYAYTMSDTLYALKLPNNTLEYLHNNYIFNEIETRSSTDLPILKI